MQVTVTELEPCKLKINYETDGEQILNKRAEVVTHFKKAPVPGYRAGRASVEAIKHHYKLQIEESLKRALAEDAYHDAVFEKKLRPHGAPIFTSASLVDGKFSCVFEVFTKPDFTLENYKGLDIPQPTGFSEEEVTEKIIQDLRFKCGEVTPYTEDDFVQQGDNVIINYTAFIDNEKIDALTAEGEMLTVGASPVPEFDHNLLGMKIGETRKFSLNVPESALPSYANKIADFEATVIMGSKTVPCALDDTLAQKLGKSSYQELREALKEEAKIQSAAATKMEINKVISQKLIENIKFEVPHWLTLSEAQYLAQRSNLDWNTISDQDKEKFLEASEKNVRLALILDRIREEEPEAQLTDYEVFDIVKSNLAKTKSKKPIDEVIEEMNRSGYMQILFARIKDEYALDFVAKNSKIIQ